MTTRRPTWQHGTLRGYEVCGGGGSGACHDCRAARNKATKRARSLGTSNPNRLVSADSPRRAIALLRARGLSDIAISRLAGTSTSNIVRIGSTAKWVRADTFDRIIAAYRYQQTRPTAGLKPGSRVDAARAHQQMKSLAALGWSLNWQRQQLGVSHDVGRQVHTQITAEIAARVQVLYDRYSGTRGPSKTAATMARREGWHVPLAYDDDGRLIPEAVPNDLTRASERREDRSRREVLVVELSEKGLSPAEIAARVGVTDRTVHRIRERNAS